MLPQFYQEILEKYLSKTQLITLKMLVWLLQIYQASTYSIINTILDLAPPWLIGIAVDILVQKQDFFIGKLGIQEVVWQFALFSLITVIVWIFESLSQYAYDRIWRNLAQNIQHNLRLDAYNHLQELESAYFEDSSTELGSEDKSYLEDNANG
jgi:ATP-binding cassette, subfamily B, bacterial